MGRAAGEMLTEKTKKHTRSIVSSESEPAPTAGAAPVRLRRKSRCFETLPRRAVPFFYGRDRPPGGCRRGRRHHHPHLRRSVSACGALQRLPFESLWPAGELVSRRVT